MARAFRLHDFLAALPAAPAELDNTRGVQDWGMMGNDALGDCTEAAKGHLVTVFTASRGTPVILPTEVIVGAYERECGYDPANPATDQGGSIAAVLDDWVRNGLGGYAVSAAAEVNITQLRVQQTVYILGGADFGIRLPLSAQAQVGRAWDFAGSAPDAPGGWGGHSVPVVRYDADGVWVVTWGALQFATWRWLMYYADEAHAVVSPDWAAPVPLDRLAADLAALGS